MTTRFLPAMNLNPFQNTEPRIISTKVRKVLADKVKTEELREAIRAERHGKKTGIGTIRVLRLGEQQR